MRKTFRFQLRVLLSAAAVSLISAVGLVNVPGQNANANTLKLEILNGHSGGGVLTIASSSDGKFAGEEGGDPLDLVGSLRAKLEEMSSAARGNGHPVGAEQFRSTMTRLRGHIALPAPTPLRATMFR